MKQTFIFTLLVFLLATFVTAQDNQISIHQQEWLAHRDLPKQPSEFDASGKDIHPMALAKSAELLANVFGYLPDWQYQSARNYLQYDLLSHIGAFDFHVSSNGDISNPSYWPWTDVINEAHDNGVKVILVAVNFDKDQIRTIISNETAKANFFSQAKAKILEYNLDGINIDFESLYSDDRGTLLNTFMSDLTDFMHTEIPGSEVSFAGPAVNWGGWELEGLANSCDYIFIMGYAFSGAWSSTTGAGAPLTGGSINITNTVTVQYEAVTNNHPEKLILGVPYYGSRWQTNDGTANSTVVSYKNHPFFSVAEAESDVYRRKWDSASQTPWYAYKIVNDWYQVWYDDAQSLGLKYDLTDNKNLRGVGMWALGYDESRTELWNELRQRYLPESQPMPQIPLAAATTYDAQQQAVYCAIRDVTFTDGFYVYWSPDGQTFADSLYIEGDSGYLEGLTYDETYFFKTRAENERGLSDFSAMTAASISDSADVLIVDGFERNDSDHNQYNYVIRHARALDSLGYTFASVQNEAVIDGTVNLNDYRVVDWFLGDESSTNTTFNSTEKTRVKNYLQNGGALFVSGSEIGWDLVAKGTSDDIAFYNDYFKADYLADAPNGAASTYYNVSGVGKRFEPVNGLRFDDGTAGTYDIDWPDAVTTYGGSDLILTFDGVDAANGGAGVAYSGTFGSSSEMGRLVYLTFPFESVVADSSRLQLMEIIMHYFESPVGIEENSQPLADFRLYQNYPNPFNPKTVISYQLDVPAEIELAVYNQLGQKVATLFTGKQNAGLHRVEWNAASLSSGLYFYQLRSRTGQVQTKKMMLVK